MLKIAEGFQIDKSEAKFGVFVDPRDNKEYPYKTFGTQTWMLKDLDYGTRVNVPTTQPGMTQAEGTCFKAKNVDNYGSWSEGRSALYILPSLSWAVPTGWHVPTKAEWTTLQNWVKEQKGSSNGYPQKALLGKTHWYNLTYAATDEYGFGLLPQGYMYRSWTGTSVYWNYVETTAMTRGYWWTSTSTAENVNNVIYFYNNGSTFSDYTTYFKSGYNIEAFPVRLIKDATTQTTEPEIESISITIPSSDASDNKVPTEKAVKDYVDSHGGSGGMVNPMTSYGDLIVGGASGEPEALSAGAEGQVLKITSGVPTWGDGLYLGAFSSSNRPQGATDGQYILDTDLGYFIYKYNDTWINASGFVVEGTPDLSQTKLFKIRDAWQIGDNVQTEGVWVDTRDGQSYPFKKFGNQIWMTVNFNYGGAENEFVTSSTAQTEGHAWRFNNVYDYNNFESQDGWSLGAYYTAGSLDNWVVPTGWHLPSMDEVNQLISWATAEYGSENNALTALATDTTWWGPTRTGIDENLLNASTFNLSPCSYCSNGSFNGIANTHNNDCHIWTGEKNGSARYYFKIGLNNNAGYTMKKEFTSTSSSFAFPIRLVYDLSATTQPVINEVTTEVNDTPSDNKLPTEKAVKTYVDNAIPPTCQENYPFIITNKKDSMTNDARKIFLMKIISQETATRTKFGFYHVSGNGGGIIMGIYNKLGELMAQTGQVDCSTAGNDEMLWFDSQNPFVMENGEEYWLAFLPTWPTGTYDNSIAPAQYETTTTTTADILSLTTLYTDNTTLPSTKPTGSYNTTVVYMAVK